MTPVAATADKESIFDRIADYVSAATVAELFIGFLVAAAANRSERNLELTLAAIADQEKHIEDVETALSKEVASNTALTQQVHDLTREIHDYLTSHRP